MKANKPARENIIAVSEITEARNTTGLSQNLFADLMGVSVRTLQDWEQGRRTPSKAARTLLKVAKRHPEVLRELAG
nr:helix-turn-helix domain-containing protein [Methylomonas sp. WSC-6]